VNLKALEGKAVKIWDLKNRCLKGTVTSVKGGEILLEDKEKGKLSSVKENEIVLIRVEEGR